MIWTNEFLNRIALEGEEQIARELKVLIDRISLPAQIGTSEFQLPEYVIDIRKVYWKGFRLDPIAIGEFENIGYDIQVWSDGAFNSDAFERNSFQIGSFSVEHSIGSGVIGGRPTQYFYYGFGENVIRINPSADEKLEYYSDGVWGTNIHQSLIVEFYRTADGINWKIPEYIRRRLIKAFVAWKAFSIEGVGQNLKAAQYHESKFKLGMIRAKTIVNNMYAAVTHIAPSNYHQQSGTGKYYNFEGDYGYQGDCNQARPMLPANFGIVLDEWDC